jgi:hypothetical protein
VARTSRGTTQQGDAYEASLAASSAFVGASDRIVASTHSHKAAFANMPTQSAARGPEPGVPDGTPRVHGADESPALSIEQLEVVAKKRAEESESAAKHASKVTGFKILTILHDSTPSLLALCRKCISHYL